MIGGISYIPVSIGSGSPTTPSFTDFYGRMLPLGDLDSYIHDPISSNEIIANEYVPQFDFDPTPKVGSKPIIIDRSKILHPTSSKKDEELIVPETSYQDYQHDDNEAELSDAELYGSQKYMTTNELLAALGSSLKGNSLKNYNAWNAAWEKWGHLLGIKDDKAYCYLLGQLMHESVGFKYMKEIASGRDYDIEVNPKKARRLGNIHPGDGVRYKGRGPIQVTGRANYTAIYNKFFVPNGLGQYNVVKNPELAEDPMIGALLSIGWLALNPSAIAAANRYDIRDLTKRINGGYNGFDHRQSETNRLLAELQSFNKSLNNIG